LLLNPKCAVRRGAPIVILESDPVGGNFHAIFVRRKDYAPRALLIQSNSVEICSLGIQLRDAVVIADGGDVSKP
jgi:hypothetical protein